MSRGKNLQEMETGTKQSKTAVNAGARAADPMQKLTTGIPDGQTGSWEDLGGPTPENYKPDDDSAKLSIPGATLKQVKNVVNKGAKAADAMKSLAKESVEKDEDEELIDESEYDDEDEVVSEAKEKSSRKEKDEEDDDEEDDDEEDDDEEEDDEEEDESGKKKKMKEAFAQIEEEIEEDVNALLSGEELSEDFKIKAKTVFEAALNARTEQIEEAIAYQYEQRLAEEVEAITEELTDRLDAYLEYVSEEWLQENALEVEQGLKTEMTESFLQGMKGLFEDHYVTIPEDRYDVLESMVEKLDEMENKLNEQIQRNVALNRRLAESVTEVIFAEVSEGLALSQKDKLASLAENVEFDSESDYREKLVTLRESYFPRNTGTQRNNSDYIAEETDYSQPVSGSMSYYLDALQRVSKK
jgi:AcrR family transcriptional regulator